MNNPLGAPAYALMPLSLDRPTTPSSRSRTARMSATQRSVEVPPRNTVNNTQDVLNTTAAASSIPRTKQSQKLLGSFSSFLSPPSSIAADKEKDRNIRPRNMYLHLDPAAAGESSNPSSRRHSLAVSATGQSVSSRSSTDSAFGQFAPSRRVSTSVPLGAESVALTASNALVGLIAASCQAQYDLEELNTSPTGRTAPLRKVHLETKSLKTTALLLHKVLRRVGAGTLENPARAKLLDMDVLIAVLTAAVLTVSELETRLENLVTQADDLGVSVEEMVQRHARSLAKDANRLDMVDFTITKMLSVLQVSDPAEAARHQAQAGFAIMDMLQADAALAGRMQQLQDAAGGLALVSSERRAELAARPPPNYSVPSPKDDDELPNYYESLDDDSVPIQPRDWSVYSGLTLDDIPVLARVSLPLILGEIKDGYFYTDEYAQSVSEGLVALEDAQGTAKSKVLAHVLGIRNDASKEKTPTASDHVGLAQRLAQKVTRKKLLGRSH